jgi:hypothetical protein
MTTIFDAKYQFSNFVTLKNKDKWKISIEVTEVTNVGKEVSPILEIDSNNLIDEI